MAMALDFAAMLREEGKRAAPAGVQKAAPKPKAPVDAIPAAEIHPELPETALSECDTGVIERSTISTAPMGKVSVIPSFLTPRAQLLLMKCVMSPGYEASGRWIRLRGRRLLQFGGQPRPGPVLEGKEPLPSWLERVVDDLVRMRVFPEDKRPNHVLVNLYGKGEGILPHTDGPLYFPRTATLSIGSNAIMEFSPSIPTELIGTAAQRELETSKRFTVGLPRGALVVFSGEAYQALHEIPATTEDVVEPNCANAASLGWEIGSVLPRDIIRVSLTIRHVPIVRASAAESSCESSWAVSDSATS